MNIHRNISYLNSSILRTCFNSNVDNAYSIYYTVAGILDFIDETNLAANANLCNI